MFRTPSPGNSISVVLRKLLQGSRRGSQAIQKFATKGSQIISDIKLRNSAFWVWEDASLWAHWIHFFHMHLSSAVVLSLSHISLFATPWTTAHQASLSFTVSRVWLKLMSIQSMMASNYLILSCSLLFLPSIFPSIRIFSNESGLRIRWLQYQSFQWIFRVDLL